MKMARTLGALSQLFPFVVSLSNHERPFDKLSANEEEAVFASMTRSGNVSAPIRAVSAASTQLLSLEGEAG